MSHALSLIKGSPPAEAREPRVVTIHSDPLTSRFDSESSKVCIGYKVASDIACLAKALEDRPVARARRKHDTVGLTLQVLNKGQSMIDWAWRNEDCRMGGDSEEPAQYKIGHTICLIAVDEFLQPIPEPMVVRSSLPIGIDQYIDVRE